METAGTQYIYSGGNTSCLTKKRITCKLMLSRVCLRASKPEIKSKHHNESREDSSAFQSADTAAQNHQAGGELKMDFKDELNESFVTTLKYAREVFVNKANYLAAMHPEHREKVMEKAKEPLAAFDRLIDKLTREK